MKYFVNSAAVYAATIFLASCGGPSEPKQPNLPEKPDRWVQSIEISADTSVSLIGKTRDYFITQITRISDANGVQKISLGDEIEGIRIGAIQCSFHNKDARYGREQYMWRGRWSCMAGRTQQEVLHAVGRNGEQRHTYILASPITITSAN